MCRLFFHDSVFQEAAMRLARLVAMVAVVLLVACSEKKAPPAPAPAPVVATADSPTGTTLAIDFQSNSAPAKGVLEIKGLQAPEPWGSWSAEREVKVLFTDCLPVGRYVLTMFGHALGPNVGAPIAVALGDARGVLHLGEKPRSTTTELDVKAGCARELTIEVPKPISPKELGLGPDARKLGIAFVQLSLKKT